MITSKPHISGSFQLKPWGGIEYDTPLFSQWTVSWVESAGCGHDSCGEDWLNEKFVTWEDAYKYALTLV